MPAQPPSLPRLRDLGVRKEVLEGNYQPSIDVAEIERGRAPEFLRDPVEFFRRTAVTPGIKTLVVKTLMALLNLREATVGGTRYSVTSKLFVLPSFFGGGKSHALATVYHVVKVVATSRSHEEAYRKLAVLDADIAEFVRERWDELARLKPKVVVVHGMYREFAPTPADGMPVKTIWGYVADRLGEYQLASTYDADATLPPIEVLERVLAGKGAVLLVDELAQYLARIGESAQQYRARVYSFIMMLSELLGSKEVPSAVAIITLPYDYERKKVEKAHAGVLDSHVVKRVLERTKVEIVRVVAPENLAEVVRKRVFDESPEKLREIGERLAAAIAEAVPAESLKPVFGRLKARLPETYPLHPETVETIRVLHEYLGEFMQLTRSPLAMIAEAVKAVRGGCFDWMGFEPHMLMPYHVPVFFEDVLTSSLSIAGGEMQKFRAVLSDAVVKSVAKDRCELSLSVPSYVPRDYVAPVYAIAVYLWLRSVAGRGLVSHSSLYPTAEDVSFAIVDLPVARDSKWYDAKTTLEREVSKLPHVREVNGRWFFKWTPRLRELIDSYAERVTDSEVESKLAEILKNGFSERGKIVFTGNVGDMLFINTAESAGGKYPAVVVFTKPVSDDEVRERVKYNNVVVLAPDPDAEIRQEEVKALDIKRAEKAWDALLAVVRYQIACEEKIARDDIVKTYEEEIKEERELADYLVKLVAERKKHYSEKARELISRVYSKVRVKRGGKVHSVDLKLLHREPPSFRVIENALLGNLVVKSVEEDWVLKLADRLNIRRDSPDGIPLNSLWQYLLTGEDDSIPVASLEWFARNALQPVRKLEYAVVAKGRVYWKRVHDSRDAAVQCVREVGADHMSDDDYENLVKEVVKLLERGDEVRLVHYKHVWERWAQAVLEGLRDEIVVLTDGSRDILLDPKRLRETILAEEVVKSYAAYRERPSVVVAVESPRRAEPGATVAVSITATSTVVQQGRLRISVAGATPQAVEKLVSLPHKEEVLLSVNLDATEVAVSVVVEDLQTGAVLGRGEASISVARPAVGESLSEYRVLVRDAKRLAERGVLVEVRELEVSSFGDYNLALHVVREVGERARVKAVFDRLVLETIGDVSVEDAIELVDSLIRLKDRFKLERLQVVVAVSEAKRRCTEVLASLPDTATVKILAKKLLW